MEPRSVPSAGEPLSSAEPASILGRIDARERQIEHALRDARETAAAIVQDARDRAEALAAARREQAAREAAERGEHIVADARRSAKEIAAAGAAEAAAVRATPAERIAQAAEALLAVVLPAAPAGGGGP